MKILRKGNLENLKNPKRFECKDCGCLFEATKEEYKVDTQSDKPKYYCECPTCKTRVNYK